MIHFGRFITSNRFRLATAFSFAALLGLAYLITGRFARVRAARDADPNVIWSIGKTDGTSDEFALGSAAGLTYEVGKSSPKDWRERQDASKKRTSVYTIRFSLDQVPASPPVLAIECYFLAESPDALAVSVNGKRGHFRIQPAPAEDVDNRQSTELTYSRQSLHVPVDRSLLRTGANDIGISFLGEDGSARYDSVALLKSGAVPADLSATVEPTIFFRRSGGELKELTQIILRHQSTVRKFTADLKLGNSRISGVGESDGYDFGDQVIELEVPAVGGPTPYDLTIAADGRTLHFNGEFQPEKRWRIFAGLKIHNDIGFTDLQPNIQELDSRNTDGVISIISRFPFYKFNLEDGWLVDNYLHSRRRERVRQLMDLAARNQIGISAMYLNLLTGLCTGEELYRSLYFSKHLEKKYGVPIKSACLTDAPSHTWFMPTLLADAGVTSFANGSNQTRAPLLGHSTLNEDSPFYWEGIDGSRVVTWFARNYRQFDRLTGAQPTIDRLHRTVPQFLARYRRGNYPVDAVMLYGLYGDNTDIRTGDAQILKEWSETYEFPKITAATDADYFSYISTHFADRLPVFRGDAGAYWEDGAGSSAAETALNRDTQRMLPAAETAAALSTAFDRAQLYPAQEFRDAWKNLLFYDEHTWGSSRAIPEPDRQLVRDQWDVKRGFAIHAHEAAKDLLTRSLNRLVQNISVGGPTLFVLNPGAGVRSDVVEVELGTNQQAIDLETGKLVPLDIVQVKPGYRVARFLAGNVPEFGYKAFGVGRASAPAPTPDSNSKPGGSWHIESRYYRIEFDPATGAIARIYDKELQRDLVDSSAQHKLNELLYVSGGDNTRIVRDILTMAPAQLEVTGQRNAVLLEKVRTPFGERIRLRARARNVPLIETEVGVYDSLKRIDITNHVKKEEVRTKEAVYFAFPFQISPPELAYQIQNAWVRPNIDQLPGACREWFATQNGVVARDGTAAIAWASPDAPLITLNDINRGRWLKSLDIKNGHIYSYAMNNYWFTNYRASQGGDFVFRYFISSGRSFNEADLSRFSRETRSPLIPYNYYDAGHVRIVPVKRHMPLTQGAFFKLDGCNAEITAFKEAEDGNGFVLRLREAAGTVGTCGLESPVFPVTAAYLTNGVEQNQSRLPIRNGAIGVPLKPHKFSTIRLVLVEPKRQQATEIIATGRPTAR